MIKSFYLYCEIFLKRYIKQFLGQIIGFACLIRGSEDSGTEIIRKESINAFLRKDMRSLCTTVALT